jgi:hypothetical protein
MPRETVRTAENPAVRTAEVAMRIADLTMRIVKVAARTTQGHNNKS